MEIKELTSLLRRLEAAQIYYRLACTRPGHIMVDVSVPGQRWEIEFSDDGQVEIEVFKSNGEIRDAVALGELFAEFSD